MPLLRWESTGPTPAQMRRLFAILKAAGLDRDDLAELMEQEGLGDDPQALTPAQYDDLVSSIETFGGLADAG